MATPKIYENWHYVQNNPHKCKIKLEKFHFDILCCFGVIKESLLGGAESVPPPPGEIGLKSKSKVCGMHKKSRMEFAMCTNGSDE